MLFVCSLPPLGAFNPAITACVYISIPFIPHSRLMSFSFTFICRTLHPLPPSMDRAAASAVFCCLCIFPVCRLSLHSVKSSWGWHNPSLAHCSEVKQTLTSKPRRHQTLHTRVVCLGYQYTSNTMKAATPAGYRDLPSVMLTNYGTFAIPWKFCSPELSLHRTFATWNFRYRDFCSLEHWLPRTKVPRTYAPWNFRPWNFRW